MKHLVLIIVLMGAISFNTYSQCDEFMVFRTKGDVKMIKGSVVQPAQKNMKAGSNCQLKVGANSYAILISGSDKALRLTSPGTFSYSDLQSMCRKNQTSLTKEYMNYVAQSIIEKEEPKTAMVIKGAVYRARTVYEKTDMVLPADSSVISSDLLDFVWHRSPGIDSKYILIYENGAREIYSKKISDTTVSISSTLFKPETIYFWLVSTNQKPADNEPRFHFVYGDKEWKTEYLDNENVMNELENEIQKTDAKIKEAKSKGSGVEKDTLK
ncbi:MAG: hypothetical protein M0P58_01225 [Bacteroidales bacterium]|jgi:hypothetical protein|nr:hypothetical protein [Bacteroidales bacterium]